MTQRTLSNLILADMSSFFCRCLPHVMLFLYSCHNWLCCTTFLQLYVSLNCFSGLAQR